VTAAGREPAGLRARFAVWRDSLGWQGVRRSLLVAAILAILVSTTRWFAEFGRLPDAGDTFIGPPRSDYTLETFALTVLGDDGSLSFRGEAPRMTRHPWLGHLDVESPDFELHTRDGEIWHAGARWARISAAADELRLVDDARIARDPGSSVEALVLTSAELVARPKEDRVTSTQPVEVNMPGSILRGVGLEADLAEKRFSLLSQVKARYEPPRR
jgi:lipopolysaccharide export system protein LptC